MNDQPRKLSEMMKEMSERLLRNPDGVPSSEAAHVALFFANVAWNECVGLDHAREGYRNVWETIEAENPELWNEFKSNDIDAMIDEIVEYKQKQQFPLAGSTTAARVAFSPVVSSQTNFRFRSATITVKSAACTH